MRAVALREDHEVAINNGHNAVPAASISVFFIVDLYIITIVDEDAHAVIVYGARGVMNGTKS